MSYKVNLVNVALSQGAAEDRTALAKKVCFERGGQVCWNVVELCRINLLEWFRDVGKLTFPTISTLARIWLDKVSLSAFQDRVVSSAGLVMPPTRTQSDNNRAEKQLLLC